MALVRWKWVDYLNIELYEHNLDRYEEEEQATAPIYYDSDEDIFFDRLNHNNLMRFWDEIEFMRYEMAERRRIHLQDQLRLMHQQHYTNFTIRCPPPAYPAPDHIQGNRSR